MCPCVTHFSPAKSCNYIPTSRHTLPEKKQHTRLHFVQGAVSQSDVQTLEVLMTQKLNNNQGNLYKTVAVYKTHSYIIILYQLHHQPCYSFKKAAWYQTWTQGKKEQH